MATRELRLQSCQDEEVEEEEEEEEEEGQVHTLRERESQSIHVVHFTQVSG